MIKIDPGWFMSSVIMVIFGFAAICIGLDMKSCRAPGWWFIFGGMVAFLIAMAFGILAVKV